MQISDFKLDVCAGHEMILRNTLRYRTVACGMHAGVALYLLTKATGDETTEQLTSIYIPYQTHFDKLIKFKTDCGVSNENDICKTLT